MIKRWRFALLVAALAVACVSIYLLVIGSRWLGVVAIESAGLPWGTLVTWAGMAALPTALYATYLPFFAHPSTIARVARNTCRSLLAAGIAWGVVCYLLAGNWSFSFSGGAPGFRGSDDAAQLFWIFSAAIPALTLLLFPVLYLLHWRVRAAGGNR